MMKLLLAPLLAFLTTAFPRELKYDDFIQDNPTFNYHRNIGIPLAKQIRKSEEATLRNPSVTIARGSHAKRAQMPYQAGLLLESKYDLDSMSTCGGSLISTSRVLTAAHCWFDGITQNHDVEVVLGSVALFYGGTRIPSRNVVMHPNWTAHINLNDIAVIYLPSTVSLSDSIATIALPPWRKLKKDFAGEAAVASGFGDSRESDGEQDLIGPLKYANLTIISNDECYRQLPIILPSYICTCGVYGRNTCEGDSGGPLAITKNKRTFVVGVASFGVINCTYGAPSVFTRVSSFMKFIRSNM